MDPCCALCKGPHGICLSRHACEHHKAAQAQDEADARARRTYRDPTADLAIRNATRTPKPKTKATPKRPFSYPKEDK
ncbi:hypothetical protein PP640_gp77 [Arthrobacter phage Faja]|uniref:Uncharacterized protein n=2 Tax=Caudoviricetes TaxID=2731619 RepID=A0A3G3M3H7_9CAUD|nr:hypothetical protein PP636_gp27 [Arthrobacter phage Hestia]YP_010656363.1 hypothetical protein PP640_gp77 [Arthrobacter phage Faja]AYN57949.1 hypothetical protein PBI_FAJA_77 [Arthrobacter phage Faja]AYR00970.1 hypothetical protein PBI_HESTIA_68 [Arthrobacter phage Hestia]